MMNKRNILIVGARGYLGNNVYRLFKQMGNYTVYGTYNNDQKSDLIKCNVLDKEDIDKLLCMDNDVIIWSVMNQQDEIEISNIGLKHLVTKLSNNVRFIYISTTIGQGKNQSEDVKPEFRKTGDYLYKYINGKIIGESIVKEHSNHVIIRPGSIYGFDCDDGIDNRMKVLLDKSQSNCKYIRTANLYGSFVNIEDLTEAIRELITHDFVGTINIAGEKAISHFEFNKYLAKLMDIDDSFIVPEFKNHEVFHTLSAELRKSLLTTKIKEIGNY